MTNPPSLPLDTTLTVDGFEVLDACHRQTLFTLGKLAALISRLRTQGADAHARAMAEEIAQFFSTVARRHHQDEEQHVFPKLLATGNADLVKDVLRLQKDHGWLEEDLLALYPQLEAVAAGRTGVDVEELVTDA
jgi:iron-sulfur cluster repair protein YtfE (RIC family)